MQRRERVGWPWECTPPSSPSAIPRSVSSSQSCRSPPRRWTRSEEHTSELQSHSDLHPFPTRRSSDLRPGNPRQPAGPHRGAPPGRAAAARALPLLCSGGSGWAGRGSAHHPVRHPQSRDRSLRASPVARRRGDGPDRKSTRLNSSHTVIYTLSLHDALPISGLVIPASPLALTAERRLDERRQRALCRYYAAAGAGGLAVGVHTTQFAIRNPAIGLFEPVLSLAAEEMDQIGRAHV